jgi:molecular chaperone GrpE
MADERETLGGDATANEADENRRPGGPVDLTSQLQDEKAKAEQYLDNWRRAAADLQNYKRRVEQERGEVGRLANASLIINILPIVDDLERALSSLDVSFSGLTWFDGIRLIHRKLQMVLENSGVTQIQAEGQTFDPRYHEAVMHAEGEEGKVVGEVQKGYKLGDRVIRPAMVVVGQGRASGEQPNSAES